VKKVMAIFATGVLAFALPAGATIIYVPADFQTIQEGVNASLDRDTVMVAPGVYTGLGNREISTAGKAIVVMGEQGAVNTVIDGEGTYVGFNIVDDEQPTTVIEGFTIRNVASGIQCELTSPTIRANIIENYLYNGIHLGAVSGNERTSPVVENCIVRQTGENYAHIGTGIHVYRLVDVTISGCRFSNCRYGMEFNANGDMWSIFQITDCMIEDNLLYGIWIHA
jgi:nitrous oxidase accessory protein NosD